MSGTLQASVVKDSASATNNLALDASGNVTVGNNLTVTGTTTHTGTVGATTFSGAVTAPSFIPNGASVPTNGMYLSAANTLNLATNSTNQVAISSTGIVTGTAGNLMLVQGTSQASTSGTSIPFSGIPSWVKRITIMFNGVSTNGTGAYQVQIGTGGAATISGYNSTQTQFGGTNQTSGSSSTTGFVFASPGASTNSYSGIMTISNISGNNWVYSSLLNSNGTTFLVAGAGNSPALAGTLDYLRVIGSATGSPSDTFDAGTINIQYE